MAENKFGEFSISKYKLPIAGKLFFEKTTQLPGRRHLISKESKWNHTLQIEKKTFTIQDVVAQGPHTHQTHQLTTLVR